MKNYSVPSIAVLSSFCVLLAADFWQQKPPDQWSEKECQRLLAKSPWAKDFPLTGVAPSKGDGKEGIGFNPSGANGGSAPSMQTALVRWTSAAPVRAALQKLKAAGPSEAELEQYYVLTVTQIHVPSSSEGPLADELSRTKDRLKAKATLLPKGKPPLRPAIVASDIKPGAITIHFLFSKSGDPIDPEDKEVLFQTEIATLNLNARFVLKDLMWGGKLGL